MSLETLKTRVDYIGGNSLNRIKQQKLNSFHAALKEDYNSRPILTPLGEEYQALINDDNTKSDYDKRYISVDFSAGLVPGDVFECLDDNTHWMIYLQDLVEVAYLKSEIIRCRYQLTIDDVNYWVYFQGPTETTVRWNFKRSTNWNDLNFSGTLYIKKDERTQNYFNRFDKLKIEGHNWQVKVVDTITVPGIIELELGEYFDSITEDLVEIQPVDVENTISGPQRVYPYETYVYTVEDPSGKFTVDDVFAVSNDKMIILNQENGRCEIEITTGKKGTFTLIYTTVTKRYFLPITILSL